MSYTSLTVTTLTAIAKSWADGVRNSVVNVVASAAARASEITAPPTGMVTFRTDSKLLEIYNGSQWVPIHPTSANVDTLQTTASAAYTDLATTGPAVTVITGTSALVTVNAYMSNTGANNSYMGFAVSSASTVVAADAKAASVVGTSAMSASGTFLITGLTSGSNVFTAKYKVGAGTGNFVYRNITVIPLP
jgi:hypothetical protein